MANITQAELKQILDNRPAGTEPAQIVQSLLAKGHRIEGLDAGRQAAVQQTATQKNVLSKIGNFLAPTATRTIEKLSAGEGINARDVLGSALEVGSFFVPVGAAARGVGLAAKGARAATLANRARQAAVIGAKTGALAEAGRAVGEGEDLAGIATRTAGGAILGAGTGAILPVAGAGVRAVRGGAIQKGVRATAGDAAEGAMQRALQINPSDTRRIMKPNVAGQTPAKWLLERNIVGNRDQITQKLIQTSAQSKKSLDDGLKSITVGYTKKQAPAAKQALDVLLGTYRGTIGNEDIVRELVDLGKKKTLTLTDINRVKRMVDTKLSLYKTTGDLKSGATIEGLSNVRNKLKVFIEDQAEANGFKNVKALNKETQVSGEIYRAILKKDAALGNNRALGLTDIIVGTVAGIGVNPIAGLSVVAAKKIAESATVQTKLAQLLYKLSQQEVREIEKAIITKKATPALRRLVDRAVQESGASATYRQAQMPAVNYDEATRGLRNVPSYMSNPQRLPPMQ